MTIIKNEFFLALNQVATERGISPDDVLESIKMAVLAAYKKDYSASEDESENLLVKINKETGETKIFIDKKEVTPPGFGRIAAQTARQVILQKIREAEKKTIIKHYLTRVGTTIKGKVVKFENQNVFFNIGRTEGILPYEEQIKNENYKLNLVYVFLIKEIKEDQFSNFKIILSRTHPKLIEELFKKETPEVASGAVKIKKIVREPGKRAKIAVFSDQPGVDPVGACVGQKGIRVKTVTESLGGEEKIDIIQYNQDDSIFIKDALSLTQVNLIEIDKEKKHAKVYVDEKQAPLAIGKNGINVNLVSKLTGYTIDIIQIPSKISEKTHPEEAKEAKQTVVKNADSKN